MKTWSGSDIGLPGVPRRPHDTQIRFFTAVLATLLIIVGLESTFPLLKYHLLPWLDTGRISPAPAHIPQDIKWDSLEATKYFEFQPCYDGFECAKLKLPLDYFNGSYPDHTISLAIIKLPAKVPVDDPRYGGPILINPGGPGGPGAFFALLEAKMLQTIVDSAIEPEAATQPKDFMNTEKYFDIIGFDPRGIGWSDPSVSCMPDEPSAWSWQLREQTEGILGSSDAALGRLWSMNHAHGASCKIVMDDREGPDIKQYMSTASVARDMLEIVERHAEHVEKQVSEKSTRRVRCKRPESLDHKPEVPKLQYWGFSYGTYLGATFASMFPDRVGRLILDGVVNSDDYNTSLGNGSLHDSDKAMSSFYTFCVLSGPDVCPLTTPASSVRDIEVKVQSIVRSLYHNPIGISSAHGPDILTYSDIKHTLFSATYTPVTAFPLVAQILAAIEQGGGAILDDLVLAYRPAHIYSCPVNNGTVQNKIPRFLEVATIAILCSDGEDQTSIDIQSFEEYFNQLVGISWTSGAIWAMLRMKCASWKIKAVHKFGNKFGGNTSHPILWISNTADPVTPLRSGKIMSSRFPGSALLVQDSAGHCSVAVPSPCTLTHIRTYFQTGAIPPPNTLCTPPHSPFSLNSTDPTSLFYDVDLATSLVSDGSPALAKTTTSTPKVEAVEWWDTHADSEEEAKMMEAARRVQRSVAELGLLGKVFGNFKVDEMMAGWVRDRML